MLSRTNTRVVSRLDQDEKRFRCRKYVPTRRDALLTIHLTHRIRVERCAHMWQCAFTFQRKLTVLCPCCTDHFAKSRVQQTRLLRAAARLQLLTRDRMDCPAAITIWKSNNSKSQNCPLLPLVSWCFGKTTLDRGVLIMEHAPASRLDSCLLAARLEQHVQRACVLHAALSPFSRGVGSGNFM